MKKLVLIFLLFAVSAMADSTRVGFWISPSDAGDTSAVIDSIVFNPVYFEDDSIGTGLWTGPDSGSLRCTVTVNGLYNHGYGASATIYYDNNFDDTKSLILDGYWVEYAVSTASSSDTVTVMIPTTSICGYAIEGAAFTVKFKGQNVKDTCNNNAIGSLERTVYTNSSGIASMPLIKNGCFNKDNEYEASLKIVGWGKYEEPFTIDDTTTSIWWLGR